PPAPEAHGRGGHPYAAPAGRPGQGRPAHRAGHPPRGPAEHGGAARQLIPAVAQSLVDPGPDLGPVLARVSLADALVVPGAAAPRAPRPPLTAHRSPGGGAQVVGRAPGLRGTRHAPGCSGAPRRVARGTTRGLARTGTGL